MPADFFNQFFHSQTKFMTKSSIWKMNLRCFSWIFIKKFSDFLGQFLATVVKIAFWISRRSSRRIFLKRFNYVRNFRLWALNFWTSGKRSLAGWTKLHFMFGKFWEKNFWANYIISRTGFGNRRKTLKNLSKKFPQYYRNYNLVRMIILR